MIKVIIFLLNLAVVSGMQLYKMIKYRNIKNIDWNQFNQDIYSGLNISDTAFFEEIITEYNEVVTRLLDDHAPHKSRKVKIVQDTPWFDFEYAHLRKLRRKAEHQYRKTWLLAQRKLQMPS